MASFQPSSHSPKGLSVSVWENGKVPDGWCQWLHDNMDVLNGSELDTYKEARCKFYVIYILHSN